MTERREQYYYNFFFLTDSNPSKERAWIELEGIEAIVKTSSKAKFFIEFYSTCLEGMILHSRQLKIINKSNLWVSSFTAETRRSSENDSQGCDVPGFLKLGWSFKQLPKVHSRLVYHGNVSFSFKVTVVSLLWTFVSQLLPVQSDMEYLQEQYLLLSVKSCDGFESYGWSFK